VTVQIIKKYNKHIIVLISLIHFIFFIFKAREKIDLVEWEKTSCYFKTQRQLKDLDCRYYNAKNLVLAQPFLNYGEQLQCHIAPVEELIEQKNNLLNTATCGENDLWSKPQKLWDLGWDAYSVWYGRAVMLFFQSQKANWPGLFNAINDPKFVKSFPNVEHHHYPWLLSAIYFYIMKMQSSPNPFLLVIIQALIGLLCIFLFRWVWPKAPLHLWLIYAFVPTLSIFLFRLYADLWILFFGLLLIGSLQRKKYFLASTLTFLGIFLKQEAFLQILLILISWILLEKTNTKKAFVYVILSFIVGFILMWRHSTKMAASNFYIPLTDRLYVKSFYTQLLPQIYGYYLDVLFRPMLWGLLWPVTFYQLWKSRKSISKTALVLFFMLVLVIIPLSFARFPFGHKEVVLTGSGRALWQTMALAWLLLKSSYEVASEKRRIS
jgi:hypothetical protein